MAVVVYPALRHSPRPCLVTAAVPVPAAGVLAASPEARAGAPGSRPPAYRTVRPAQHPAPRSVILEGVDVDGDAHAGDLQAALAQRADERGEAVRVAGVVAREDKVALGVLLQPLEVLEGGVQRHHRGNAVAPVKAHDVVLGRRQAAVHEGGAAGRRARLA